MKAEVWFSVGVSDFFPEDFRLFFSGYSDACWIFEEMHSDLYEVSFWTNLQKKINEGYIIDVFPYRRSKRFSQKTHSDFEVFTD